MTVEQPGQRAVGRGGTGVADAGGNAPAGGVDLLVAGALRAQVELADPVAAEGGVRVAVDQPRDGGTAAGVVHGQVGVVAQHLFASTAGGDAAVHDRDRGAADDLHLAQGGTAGGRRSDGARILREV